MQGQSRTREHEFLLLSLLNAETSHTRLVLRLCHSQERCASRHVKCRVCDGNYCGVNQDPTHALIIIMVDKENYNVVLQSQQIFRDE